MFMSSEKEFTCINEFLKSHTKTTESIVFTNGCFDLLHPGHLFLLKYAKSLGNKLVIGLNSDFSVRQLKGPDRPINNFYFRASMLSYFSFVDYIIGFNEDTPINIIQALRPNVIIKGGDYTAENIVGADFISGYGGRVITVPIMEGFSTSNTINKIHERNI